MNLSAFKELEKLDQTKKQKSQKFIQIQAQQNNNIKNSRLKNNYYVQAVDVMRITSKKFPSPNKVKFNDVQISPRVHKQVLDEQIMLHNLQTQYQFQKSRIQDQQNAKTFRNKNPFGKQNVKIAEDVLQKYSMNNYLNQGQILRKFQQQAKKRRQGLKSAKRININQNQSVINYEKIRRQQQNKKKLIQQYERNKIIEQKQKRRLKMLQKQLSLMKQKMAINNSVIGNGYENFRRDIEKNEAHRDRLAKMQYLDKQWQIYRKKIPIVIYQNKPYNALNYFTTDIHRDIKTINKNQIPQKPKQYKQVLKIFKMNQLRLEYLTTKCKQNQNPLHNSCVD